MAVRLAKDGWLLVDCPACGHVHALDPQDHWWNGESVMATVSPAHHHHGKNGPCELLVLDGELHYLSGSGHVRAGQSVKVE